MANKPIKPYRYQYGSEAKNYQTTPYKLPKETQEPLKRPRVQACPKVEWAFALKMISCSALVFIGALSFVYLSSILSSKQIQLKRMTTELRDTQSNISHLEATIASKLNLEHIQYVAYTQLNMSEPLPHQIVYIEIPKESHTIYPNE